MKTNKKCRECKKYLEEKIVARMNSSFSNKFNNNEPLACYNCGSNHLLLGGEYNTLKDGIKQRWKCSHCSSNFISRTKAYRKKHSLTLIKKILRYSTKHKGYFNKYDNTKKTTYSTRELADMFGMSSSGISNLLRNLKGVI